MNKEAFHSKDRHAEFAEASLLVHWNGITASAREMIRYALHDGYLGSGTR